MMLIGRFVGASIGEKVSSRTMITVVSSATIILVLFGMFAPTITVAFPGVNWGTRRNYLGRNSFGHLLIPTGRSLYFSNVGSYFQYGS